MTQEASASPDLSSLLDLGTLPDDPSLLKQLLAQLILLVRKETKRREEVEQAIDALLKSLRRSKSLDDCQGQGQLFPQEDGSAEEGTSDDSSSDLSGTLNTDPPADRWRRTKVFALLRKRSNNSKSASRTWRSRAACVTWPTIPCPLGKLFERASKEQSPA